MSHPAFSTGHSRSCYMQDSVHTPHYDRASLTMHSRMQTHATNGEGPDEGLLIVQRLQVAVRDKSNLVRHTF